MVKLTVRDAIKLSRRYFYDKVFNLLWYFRLYLNDNTYILVMSKYATEGSHTEWTPFTGDGYLVPKLRFQELLDEEIVFDDPIVLENTEEFASKLFAALRAKFTRASYTLDTSTSTLEELEERL